MWDWLQISHLKRQAVTPLREDSNVSQTDLHTEPCLYLTSLTGGGRFGRWGVVRSCERWEAYFFSSFPLAEDTLNNQ